MSEQSISSDDMSIARFLQDYYRVPDYQREYVWGEDARELGNDQGDEVEQFLADIHAEFVEATSASAPEYFIGTVVVCEGDGVYELIDGQQRATTIFLTLCAIRDALDALKAAAPDPLAGQIASSSTDWQGKTTHRVRLDLQYDDARGVLSQYAIGGAEKASAGADTRSIANLAAAYATIRTFFNEQLKNDPDQIRRFYGFFTNKVKLIRIRTPTLTKALRIFETINARGVGLDAMDLLKNLLFMHASQADFGKLKDSWKAIVDVLHKAGENPLRFLRYFLLASYDVAPGLREESIYDWFVKNESVTGHRRDPLGFVQVLLGAAGAYANFAGNKNPRSLPEAGLANTRTLGGRAVRQQFILLLAGRTLPAPLFSRLANEIEQLMFVWLVTGTLTKTYEGRLVEGARKLRTITTPQAFEGFCREFFHAQKRDLGPNFHNALLRLSANDMRAFRLRYLLAKLTQHVDIEALGSAGAGAGAGADLARYFSKDNDVEHILPVKASPEALQEFGASSIDAALVQRLGNLMIVEKSVNRSISNKRYSEKIAVYPSSQFLLVRCQASRLTVGINDQITRTMARLEVFPEWSKEAIAKRQTLLATLAKRVWEIPEPPIQPTVNLAP